MNPRMLLRLSVLLLPLTGLAQLQTAPIFADNMVLQRDRPVHIWGKAAPGNRVTVHFAGGQQSAVIASDSSWHLYFPAQKSNIHPQSILIKSGAEVLTIKNLLIGDLWICSGQSNMEFPMTKEAHFRQEAPEANQPLIRLCNPPPAGRYVYGTAYTDSLSRRLTKDSFYRWNGWNTCDSNTVKEFSAVAYYFAKKVVQSENIPIGLINLSIGGAPAETFISREALAATAQFRNKVKPGNWLNNNDLPEWVRERGRQNVGDNNNNYADDLGPNHAYKPGFAYACGIEPLLPMPIKGIIWYQGESNSLEPARVEEYRDLLHLMINDYRKKWKQPAMPFYWVQLSSIDTTNYRSQYWPLFRNEQRLLLSEIQHGGMAVCSDLGFKTDVHPTNKKDVGERLANWALYDAYHKKIVPSGPLPLKAGYKNNTLVINFQYADGLKTSDGKAVRGFSINGQTTVPATIRNNSIVIETTTKPAFIYYAWQPYTDANLVNAAGLPASTFKIEVQEALPSFPDSLFSTYYWQRVTHFNTLPATKDDIIFLGNSITDGAEWSELFNDSRIKNRGISGDITAGVLNRLQEITQRKPAKVFLLIGTNDLARNIPPDSIAKNILSICAYIRQESPATALFVQSILPVSDHYKKFTAHTGKGEQIQQLNALLKQHAEQYRYRFIDLFSSFCDSSGKLKSSLTNDGLHLTGKAYLLWKHLLYPYVYGLQQQPALVPLPRKMTFRKECFPLYACKNIFISADSLLGNAVQLQQQLQQKGVYAEISSAPTTNDGPRIECRIAKVPAPTCENEAYTLEISSSKIVLTANTRHGLFNAMQTLLQLARDNTMIDGCTIHDWPAFSWRAYMVDVGRNFQSLDLLKQQIDVMSRYKLNIFHFHFTEDIAWRLHSNLYPTLTAPENMQRNKGMHYSENDLKELIAYCRERYIILVPEIDMPGHSAAFKRAMGVDMQSDSGLTIVKRLLKEFCDTYDLPYMHIGGDEVPITNRDFMPSVTNFLHDLGKTTIAWSPGASTDAATIRQLWMSDNGKNSHFAAGCIDSRHLYINHMDPLESVVTIFFRQIGDTTQQNARVKGATLCLWHDRKVAREEDPLRMNPVYPAMLAFAERSWRGGGNPGWTAVIGQPSSSTHAAFTEFENRLLDHKEQYFKQLAFPYAKQADMVWSLYGPFPNQQDFSKKFSPETKSFNDPTLQPAFTTTGGTIILRHWWAPLITGALNNPEENTTWYATTKIWSDENTEKDFWIGFNNISRSHATDSPLPGTWDNHQSDIWVNGKTIAPPLWRRGGQKGDAEIPLTDEGYEYRPPTKIALQKGWNTIWIKAPIGSFKATDWQNPVKWMFTCLPL